MKLTSEKYGSAKVVSLFLFTLILTAVAVRPSRANEGALTVPSGTILPVRLNSTISSTNCKPGQEVKARIMQDVPLPSGMTVRAGSKVIGHVVEVLPATSAGNARISMQFDKLISSGQTVRINTNLRAIAGFMGVIEAQTPTAAPGEGDDFYALTTVQIGGDIAYGYGGPVTTNMNPNDVVGKELRDGMLGQVRAKEGTNCRGAVDGNNNPQALWVFSSDACGTYQLDHISIAHAGRTAPVGVIVLSSDKKVLKISEGAGMLLRVTTVGPKA
jgi:hypothetical protein